MNGTPDANDIIFETYFLNIGELARRLYEGLFGGDYDAFLAALSTFWSVFSIIAIIISILLFLGYIYARIRYEQLVAFEEQQLHDAEIAWAHTYGDAAKEDSRWGDILNHVAGPNPSEWRVAIIEADILLDEVLESAGYRGVSIADRLKDAESRPFSTLQDAWEGHKVRNRIAHAGGDFVLTKKIAQETITRYERVFREFGAV